MKIAPDKLSQLIKRASIWSGSPELKVCEFDFGKRGVKLAQLNSTYTIAVHFIASRELFSEYKQIGKVQLPAERIAKVASQAFKTDREIDIDIRNERVGDEKAKFIFVEGGEEKYFKQLPEEELPTKKLDIETAKFGILPKGIEIERFYSLPAEILKDIFDIGAKSYEFNFGNDLLIKNEDLGDKNYIVEGFSRQIDYTKTWGSGVGTTYISSEYLQRALTQFSGEMVMGFVGSEKEIILTQRDNYSAWSYRIAPRRSGV